MIFGWYFAILGKKCRNKRQHFKKLFRSFAFWANLFGSKLIHFFMTKKCYKTKALRCSNSFHILWSKIQFEDAKYTFHLKILNFQGEIFLIADSSRVFKSYMKYWYWVEDVIASINRHDQFSCLAKRFKRSGDLF